MTEKKNAYFSFTACNALRVARTISRVVTEDVFVSTSQQLSDASNHEFAVECSITDNWQLKASTTTRGNDGIDVFWQKRY